MGKLSQVKSADASVLFSALHHLLRPLVRMLLDRGVSFDRFVDVARKVYVDVAAREMALPNRKQTVSRISVLTGLSRKEVVRCQEEPLDAVDDGSFNRAARVMNGWLQAYPMEGTASGAAPLPMEGRDSFAEVVRRFSGDMPVRAVLDELQRVGAVRVRGDEVELLFSHYIPALGDTRKLTYLGEDGADLIETIRHNLSAAPAELRLQRKAFYDNVPVESLAAVRLIARERGERLLDELAREMSRHDRDVNPEVRGSGRMRTVVGIYYAEEPYGPQEPPPEHRRRGPRTKTTAPEDRAAPQSAPAAQYENRGIQP